MSQVSPEKSQQVITKFRCKALGQDRSTIGVYVVVSADGQDPKLLPMVVRDALETLGLIIISTKLCSLGRKKRNIPVKNVCDAVRRHPNVAAAARDLGISAALIYKMLGADTIKELQQEATPDAN